MGGASFSGVSFSIAMAEDGGSLRVEERERGFGVKVERESVGLLRVGVSVWG